MIQEFLFNNRTDLLTELAENCQTHLSHTLSNNGVASLLVSGGNTPAPLYERLSRSSLDWDKISVALVDERWVDRQHAASNEALIYRSLLLNNAKSATFVAMKNSAGSAIEGCTETESLYQQLPQPFTLTILGMGNDGHTASLFPHAQGLASALDSNKTQLTAAIMAKQSEVTGPNTERLTLTLKGLLQSERLIILLTGEEKLGVLRKAMSEGPVADMPIRAILRQTQVPVELYWAA